MSLQFFTFFRSSSNNLSLSDLSCWSTPTSFMVWNSETKYLTWTVSLKKKLMTLLMMINLMLNQLNILNISNKPVTSTKFSLLQVNIYNYYVLFSNYALNVVYVMYLLISLLLYLVTFLYRNNETCSVYLIQNKYAILLLVTIICRLCEYFH